jgi:hypothetical protein
MSFSNFPAGTFALLGGVTPFVSDIEIEDSVASGQCAARIRFGSTGGDSRDLYKEHALGSFSLMGDDDASSPVDHTGEWTTQVITASEWEVAMLSLDSGSFLTTFVGLGVYTTLDTADIIYGNFRVGGKGYTPGTTTGTATFRIREVADTGNFVDFEVICTAIQT